MSEDLKPRSQATLASNARSIIELAEQTILILGPNDHDQAEADVVRLQLSRFKVWAGTSGAHRDRGHRSLEHRLRDAVDLRRQIDNLLTELRATFQKGNLRRSSQE